MKELKIADNIRFFRKANNLTQEELSKQLGGSKNLVSNYENGISTPDIYTLVNLRISSTSLLTNLSEENSYQNENV